MGGLDVFSAFNCDGYSFWHWNRHRCFTQVEISYQSALFVSFNMIALSVHLAIPKCTGRLVKKTKRDLFLHFQLSLVNAHISKRFACGPLHPTQLSTTDRDAYLLCGP